MANLSKSRTLFGFTSPRTIEKIIPEIKLLTENFKGQKWAGNEALQKEYFELLFNSDAYQGDKRPKDMAFAARDRINRTPKALGFVDIDPNVNLTDAGARLISQKRLDEIITKQILKFQLPSPFHKQSSNVTFGVKPYLELLRLIRTLDSISKTEIALYFLQLTHYNKFNDIVSSILQFRQNAKAFKGSRKTYVSQCFEKEILKIFQDEILNKKLKTRESTEVSLQKFVFTKSRNMKDYADAFVRYIRATELVTFQRHTFHLIISPQKIEEVDYILDNIERAPQKFQNKELFKAFLYDPNSLVLLNDNKELLQAKLTQLGVKVDFSDDIEVLKDQLEIVSRTIKSSNIEAKKKEIKSSSGFDDIISVFTEIKKKTIPDPSLFLEWNVWRAFVLLNYAQRIDGNFTMDIDGMPLNTAPGNMGDIEIEFEDFSLLCEVTLSSGQTQFKMEGDSVPRHFGSLKKQTNKETYCLFVAPKVSEGTVAFFYQLNNFQTSYYGGKTKLIPISLNSFIEFFKTGIELNFSNPDKLHIWLEQQWELSQRAKDEVNWISQVTTNIRTWAK